MPILRLVAEGVGPFEKLDLDLSDGKGNPHLGPHILAGVNGSGKSTVLKTIAWVLDRPGWGFDRNEWKQSLAGHQTPRAAVEVRLPGDCVGGEAVAVLPDPQLHEPWKVFDKWLRSVGLKFPSLTAGDYHSQRIIVPNTSEKGADWRYRDWSADPAFDVNHSWACPVAVYAPSPKLRYLVNPDPTKSLSSAFENALAFGDTVQNELVQSWLVGLHSKQAIARQMNQPAEEYSQALARFESALRLIYEDKLRLVPELKPGLHPRIKVGKQSLNFSQIPDGIRSTIGWLSDFMNRQDLMQWDAKLKGKRPGVLLLDEVDAHLHPQWQRTLLPALRKALPDVQIIVTSHSPFIISSCLGSKVHLCDIDDSGRASLKPPCNNSDGKSYTTTLKGIFGVESRFDVRTERELDEWYQLSRKEATGPVSATERRRMAELTEVLAGRSEELRGIVSKPVGLPKSIESMLKSLKSKGKTKSRQRKAG